MQDSELEVLDEPDNDYEEADLLAVLDFDNKKYNGKWQVHLQVKWAK